MESPTSSSFSSSSGFSALPVAALRERIVEKVVDNRVTLIVGETGCGKSSQVPQFLLEANMKPILCTQPRRFAVVAVAKTVAKARKCEVGGEVGYHIGHSKLLSASTELVFKTAGVLLEEMRDKGLNALKYKVIILDEVHERSAESDLVLVCVKQFMMKNKDLRVVLMSATADLARYRDYFRDLGRDERVEVLAIPSTNQKTIYERKIFYLEQATKLLGIKSDSSSLSSKYCAGPTPSDGADIPPGLHQLIHDLVFHIHNSEPDLERSILVFLPTYYALEQQWDKLKPFTSTFKVHILHSSIDTEQALMTMKIWRTHRKVILATNIAESSVTIPKLAYVIDSCRSLQVFWDKRRKKESAELIWVSKSQAEQRRGRTGRTCDGQVYRLVTGSFFSKFEDYEMPALLRSSLRQQLLQICCAESKAINDPKVLLQKSLDPPNQEVVEEALNLLVHMKILEKTSLRGRYEPTFYGRLLASFALSFEASVLILKLGSIGMLREGILLGVLMDIQPLPILRPFGNERLGTEHTASYFQADLSNAGINGRKEVQFMGNLCAYQFWQRVFKDEHRVEHLKQLLVHDGSKASSLEVPNVEEEWCSIHNLVQSSLNNVSRIYEDVLNSVHRYRPYFLGTSYGRPSYYDPHEFEHICFLQSLPEEDSEPLVVNDEPVEPLQKPKKCLARPFVGPKDFAKNDVANSFASVIKEIKAQCTQDAPAHHYATNFLGNVNAPICIYFLKGFCNRGGDCPFSHSLQGERPTCKFFFTLQGCRKGVACAFSHGTGQPEPSSSQAFCFPEDENTRAERLLGYLPVFSPGRILVFDDTDLHFSSNLTRYLNPSKIVATTSLSTKPALDTLPLEGVEILSGLSHPYETVISKAGKNSIPWYQIKCALWFPDFSAGRELVETHRMLLKNFFEYLSIRIIADNLNHIDVILTMNNIRFSQLEVEKVARESFFFLTESFPFEEISYGQLRDTITTAKPMVSSRAVSYVFNLSPPSGDVSVKLRQALSNVSTR